MVHNKRKFAVLSLYVSGMQFQMCQKSYIIFYENRTLVLLILLSHIFFRAHVRDFAFVLQCFLIFFYICIIISLLLNYIGCFAAGKQEITCSTFSLALGFLPLCFDRLFNHSGFACQYSHVYDLDQHDVK